MTSPAQTSEQILEQLLSIGPMALGKLTPVYRNGGDQPTYFKLQVWKEGRNHTRHVKAHELADIQQRIANRCQAEELFSPICQPAGGGAPGCGRRGKKRRDNDGSIRGIRDLLRRLELDCRAGGGPGPGRWRCAPQCWRRRRAVWSACSTGPASRWSGLEAAKPAKPARSSPCGPTSAAPRLLSRVDQGRSATRRLSLGRGPWADRPVHPWRRV